MAYNSNALTDIGQLKKLAERGAKAEAEIKSLQDTVEGIASEGGEPNKIDTIQVNGTTLTVTNKTVNITVPTKLTELTNDANYATTSDVSKAVAEIIADAPDDLNTLKEIADWIENHADSASEMNSEIKANAEDIEELKNLIGSLPAETKATTVIQYIQEMVEAAEYTHPSHTAYASGLYKITVDSLGHVTAATAAVKSDITALGIPEQDTTYDIATDAEVEEMLAEVFG